MNGKPSPITAWSGNTTECTVVDLGLWHQHGELPFDRYDLPVTEESARAESRTVDDERLAQRHEVSQGVKLADDDPASKQKDVTYQGVEIDRRLDPERRAPTRVHRRKRMLPGLQDDPPCPQPQRTGLTLARAWHGRLVHEAVAVYPRDAVVPAHQELKLLVTDLGGANELRIPCRCATVFVDEP